MKQPLPLPSLWQEASFQRQLKRKVKAPDLLFLVKAPQHLLGFLHTELSQYAFTICETAPYGFYVQCRLAELYPFLINTRFSSQVYLVFQRFQAKSREELYKKAVKLPWDLWLHPEIGLACTADLKNCRIQHEGQAADTVLDAMKRRLREAGFALLEQPQKTRLQVVDVFAEQNTFELRLNLAGQHLHKRGYRIQHAGAPIRETLAAGIIAWYSQQAEPPEIVFDPMCGSATMLIEAWAFFHAVSPSFYLQIIHKNSPAFQEASWDYAIRQCESRWKEAIADSVMKIRGADMDKAALDIATENCSLLHLDALFRLEEKDFFTYHLKQQSQHKLLLTNLPYGLRKEQQGKDFLKQFLSVCSKHYQDWDKVFVYPTAQLFEPLKKLQSLRFLHGGLDVAAVYWPKNFKLF